MTVTPGLFLATTTSRTVQPGRWVAEIPGELLPWPHGVSSTRELVRNPVQLAPLTYLELVGVVVAVVEAVRT